ncbi:MAG: RNA polymerase subunit sigma-70 [Pirellula sp.]|nr:RNA polymerase subunit sigma-70 [Pirellula sp.]
MNEGLTTIAVQRYLGELARLNGDAPAEPIIRALIESSVTRLQLLCRTLLLRSYPRLMRPPLNLQTDEMLSAVVDRLFKAMREVRPTTVRQFFALANQHIRWELNDFARRLDRQAPVLELHEAFVPAPDDSGSQLTPNALRMLEAVESLPEEEREVFSLVRIQGMSHGEVADVLGVVEKTVRRRLNRSLLLLADKLKDLNPVPPPTSKS